VIKKPRKYEEAKARYRAVENTTTMCCNARKTNSLLVILPRINILPTPVAALSKAWVCGRSLAGIAGSNPAGGMDAYLIRVVCVVRYSLCV
jgi:hypothetical protein